MTRSRWTIVNRRTGAVVSSGALTNLRRQLPVWRTVYARAGIPADLVIERPRITPVIARAAGAL